MHVESALEEGAHPALVARGVEQVREDDGEATLPGARRVVRQPLVQTRAAARLHPAQEVQEVRHLITPARRRPALGHSIAERAHADPLEIHEPHEAERGGDASRGIELGGRAEIHGRRGVDDQMKAQILLVDEELDVQPIEATVDVPVDVAEVVADAVRAIVAELDAVPPAQAPPLAFHAPAKDAAREQREALELRQKLRREERLARRRHASLCLIARRAPGNSS